MGIPRGLALRAGMILVGVALVSGCSPPFSSDDDDPESAPPGQTRATGQPAEALAFEESVEWLGARTSVTDARRPFGEGAEASNGAKQEWLGVHVVTCAGDVPVETGWYLFAAHGPSAERYPALRWTDAGWPRPQYPQRTIDPGKCVNGWVLIPVVATAPVATVRLSDPDGIPIGEWVLPEAIRS